MEGVDPKDVQDAADQIVSLINGRIKKSLASLYGLVFVAARSLANTSGLDPDTVEVMLVGAIRHALQNKREPPKHPALRELEQWEIAQLRSWMGKVPEC